MAMIRPETEMKDSGVQWLGNIPKEWSVGKVKHEFYATKTIVGDKVNDYERLALTLNGVIKRSKDAGDGLQPEKFDGYQILKEHELVFKLIDLANVSTSRVGLSPYTGIVSPAYIVLHHRKDMNPRYGEYYFLSMWMNEVFNHIGGDGVRSALNAKDLLNIPYLKVSPDEQQAIADYLDETCSQIDEIIAEARASIDEYKELKQSVITEAVLHGFEEDSVKHSSIEWIGDYNSAFGMTRIGRFCFVTKLAGFEYTNAMADSIVTEFGVPIVRAQNVKMFRFHSDKIGEFIPEDISFQLNRSSLDKKCLLITFIGAGIGDVCVFDEKERYHLAPNVAKIVIFDEYKCLLDEHYLMYYLGSEAGQGEIRRISKASAQPSLSMETIRSINVVLPPLGVQKQIVEYLNKKMLHMDSLIAEKEALINDLEAYKKSLIYEVVTGKRRVV